MARAKKAAAPVTAGDDAGETAPQAMIAPSAIEMVALGRLKRAPENVRKTNKAVDVESLADDIAAHGLLQSLIGYAGDTAIDKAVIYIVGGGRRLQALELLAERGQVDADFAVPVLLRDAADAVALSLSENLGKRDMNAADEFVAFDLLMKPGVLTPADLAKQFGFTERYVRQRLRLASLAPDILDGLRAGRLTIDAGMAYARTQDQALQLRIFRSEDKKSWGAHSVQSIQSGITNAQITTGSGLFKFVGARDYEKKGGGYEDDLFGDAEGYSGRKLTHPDLVTVIAADRAHFQQVGLLADAKAKHGTTSDLLLAPGLAGGRRPKAPKGYEMVERPYWRSDLPPYPGLRDKAAALGIDIVGIASIDHLGKLVVEEQFFVPGARMADLIPPMPDSPRKSDAELAAERKAKEVRSVAAWLAAKHIRAEKIEGRQFWETTRPNLWNQKDVEGIGACYSVGVDVLVTPEEIDAQMESAAVEYELQEAEKVAAREAAEKAQAEAADLHAAVQAELLALDPPPAVVMLGDMAFFRWNGGCWCEQRQSDEADPDYGFDDLPEALEWAAAEGRAIGGWYIDLAAYDAQPPGGEIDHSGLAQDVDADDVEQAA